MGETRRRTDANPAIGYKTSADDECRAPLLSELDALGLGRDCAVYELMSRLGEKAHEALSYCYKNYTFEEDDLKAEYLLENPSLYPLLVNKIEKVLAADFCEYTFNIWETRDRLIESNLLTKPLLSQFVFAVERYIAHHKSSLPEFRKFWDAHFRPPAEIQKRKKILPGPFIVLVSELVTDIEKYVFNNPRSSGADPEGCAELTMSAFLIPYFTNLDEWEKAIKAVREKNPSDTADGLNDGFKTEVDDFLLTIQELENKLLLNKQKICKYGTDRNAVDNPSFFASRIALAAIWFKECPCDLTLHLITAFLLRKELSPDELVAFAGNQYGTNKSYSESQTLWENLYNAEYGELSFKIRTEYGSADDFHQTRGSVTDRYRYFLNRFHIRFLCEIFESLLQSDNFKDTTKISLASKLALYTALAKPGTAYEPPSLIPHPSVTNGKRHPATALLTKVFVPLASKLCKSQKGGTTPPILDMVRKIYFSDAKGDTLQDGFNWPRQTTDWSNTNSDAHIVDRLQGKDWGGSYFWLYGKNYAEVVEDAIASCLDTIPQKLAMKRCPTPKLTCNFPVASESQGSLQIDEYLAEQTFRTQLARLARFIFLIPKHFSKGKANGIQYKLKDYPLVSGELRGIVLALTNKIILRQVSLLPLYQPIYDSHKLIQHDNPYYGMTGDTP